VADETFIGGKPKNRHRSRRERDNELVSAQPGIDGGNIKTDKTAVFSLIDKATGEVRSRVVPDVGCITPQGHGRAGRLRSVAPRNRRVKAYKGIGTEFASHQAVDHTAGEYVRGTVSTNMADGYFSQLKRSIDGTHHHVSVQHLPRYLGVRLQVQQQEAVRLRADGPLGGSDGWSTADLPSAHLPLER
jgi:hypothetical protein